MSTRLYKKLPTQLWQLSTSFLSIPYLVSRVPRLSKFFNTEIVWNATTSAALLWHEMDRNYIHERSHPLWIEACLPTVFVSGTILALACGMNAPVHHIRILLQTAPDNINVPDDDEEWTPLWHAVENRSADTVDLLLKSNADPSIMYDGETLLFRACGYGNYAIVDSLLHAYDGNVNIACDSYAINALSITCRQGHRDIVELLLKHGAIPTHQTSLFLREWVDSE